MFDFSGLLSGSAALLALGMSAGAVVPLSISAPASAQATAPTPASTADVITTLPPENSAAAVTQIKSDQAKTFLTSASALLPEPSDPQIPETASKTTDSTVAQADGTFEPDGTAPGTDGTVPGTDGTTPDGTIPGTDGTTPDGTIPGTDGTTPDSTIPGTDGTAPDGTDGVAPGRATRGGSSYIGVAGNIGLSGGEQALGDGNFAVISKIGLTNAISVRPSAVIGENTTFLIPVTYDFSFQPADAFAEPVPFAPYVGAGLAISTGDDSNVGALLSAGVDVPITSQFTATAGVNVGLLNDTSVGLLIGVGYNFSGF